MKFKKALLGGLAAISLLTSGLTVAAEGTNAANGHSHDPSNSYVRLYNREKRVQKKTGEHEVYLDGMNAVCYIYEITYENIYYCNICGNYPSTTEIVPNQHSICNR